jgi:hypothetical protein
VVAPIRADGIYTPTTNREIYQLIASDFQEIALLANQVTDGKPLPSAEILKIYEESKLARVGTQTRLLRNFAREEARATEFPDEAAFFGSKTFLDDPVIEAINGTGSAAGYTPAQRGQVIQKGLQNIIYHWSARYMAQARGTLNPGLVDEGWAIYMGKETADGKYPDSISALAVLHETNFARPGALDVPLRQAMSRAQQAAISKNQAAYNAAEQDVYSRFNAIFYLGATYSLNEALKSAQAGNAAVHQVAGRSLYRAIQATVARADAAADKTVIAYYPAPPATLTAQLRDEALAAINRAAAALLLKPADLVTPAMFR